MRSRRLGACGACRRARLRAAARDVGGRDRDARERRRGAGVRHLRRRDRRDGAVVGDADDRRHGRHGHRVPRRRHAARSRAVSRPRRAVGGDRGGGHAAAPHAARHDTVRGLRAVQRRRGDAGRRRAQRSRRGGARPRRPVLHGVRAGDGGLGDGGLGKPRRRAAGVRRRSGQRHDVHGGAGPAAHRDAVLGGPVVPGGPRAGGLLRHGDGAAERPRCRLRDPRVRGSRGAGGLLRLEGGAPRGARHRLRPGVACDVLDDADRRERRSRWPTAASPRR